MVDIKVLRDLSRLANAAYAAASDEFYKVVRSGECTLAMDEVCIQAADAADAALELLLDAEREEIKAFPTCEAEKSVARKLEDAEYRIRVLEEELRVSKATVDYLRNEASAWQSAFRIATTDDIAKDWTNTIAEYVETEGSAENEARAKAMG